MYEGIAIIIIIIISLLQPGNIPGPVHSSMVAEAVTAWLPSIHCPTSLPQWLKLNAWPIRITIPLTPAWGDCLP